MILRAGAPSASIAPSRPTATKGAKTRVYFSHNCLDISGVDDVTAAGTSVRADLIGMAQRVNLDAMIPREDFGVLGDGAPLELIRDFPISNLESGSPVRRLLRKPDFQRETNHWTPEQIATFVASFLDNEVVPSLILWKSPSFIFVIDGGHRLSALRAWIEDDYGDGPISQQFYNGEISTDQKRVARRARKLIEERVGRFSTLRNLVGSGVPGSDSQSRRIGLLFTRALSLQWVTGTPERKHRFSKSIPKGRPWMRQNNC